MVYIPINIEEAVKKECRRRYSERTIKTYLYCIERFLKFSERTIDRISKKRCSFIFRAPIEKKYSR